MYPVFVAIIIFASFFGVYKKEDFRAVNLIKGYDLGMQFTDSKVLKMKISTEEGNEILDKARNVLENVTKEHLLEVAKKLCIKNNMDYIIANDLHDLRQGEHISFLVNCDGYQNIEFHSPDDIYETTKKLVLEK